MKEKSLEEDADNNRLEEISRDKVPVVLMYQPTRSFKVPSDRLQEWEELLKERVGIPKSARFGLPNGALAAVTCCPRCDDCGYER